MSFLTISHLKKSFGATTVVHDFNLNIEKGEFISFLGPSGCGKTTVLRMVAGFETPTSGTISIGGKDVVNLKPNQRNIGMVFQAYALFPNMTVAQNVAFGLKVAKKPQAEINATVHEMLSLIKLDHLAERFPYQLSGGQQQRVALARALATKPQVLLLDEPLSALDAKIRVSLREEIRAIQRKLGITTIFVTHDQEEALSISDRIVVMYEGKAEQVGAPFEIYNHPSSRFVASFVGTLNTLDAVVRDAATGMITVDGKDVSIGLKRLNGHKTGDKISLAVRPEAVSLGAATGSRETTLDGRINSVHFLGSVIRIRASLGENTVSFDTFNDPSAPPPVPGEDVKVSLAAKDLLVLEH
ncbi:ABC transporter ATP-binding protein [Phyllobacterium myrsinacearum]|uniref:Putative spermidine/putrescine transport system ATP-binding protein n=1 Tax=Phyllobacterium myrsinacearum TaxID=28101 RepID=A0A839EQG7_9HYPH|nr:ABC transporter ATP-binding protein [Phyllobacterium myrsinacearum]MBA8881139.1 putative spermidine/putrescine transport system ATP-binding protein [Phyllobacterium myrsinacearum]